MIKYIKHTEINKEKWDNCISSSQNKVIYALSWYLDAVSPKWSALVEDDYKTVMPISHNKKYGVNYAYQALFAQQLGVFSKDKVDASLCKLFVDAIPQKFYEINLNTHNPTEKLSEHKVINNTNYELDLNKDYAEIYASYSDNHKRNIKKAIKNELKIEQDVHENTIIEIFRRNKGKDLTGINLMFYERLYDLVHITKDSKCLKVLAVSHQNKIIAGAFFLEKFERAIFIFSATTKEAKDVGAMAFLVDDYIKNNAKKTKLLDFEGSNNIGIAKFYAGFGSQKVTYPFLRHNKFKNPMKLIVNVIKGTSKNK